LCGAVAFGAIGILYETDHGPSSDELNIIQPGGIYAARAPPIFKDDKVHSYINWSVAPETVERILTPTPVGMPESKESGFDGDIVDLMVTYFTVTATSRCEQCSFVCNPTAAPSSVLL